MRGRGGANINLQKQTFTEMSLKHNSICDGPFGLCIKRGKRSVNVRRMQSHDVNRRKTTESRFYCGGTEGPCE